MQPLRAPKHAYVLQGEGSMKSATLCVNGLSDTQVTDIAVILREKNIETFPVQFTDSQQMYILGFFSACYFFYNSGSVSLKFK